MKRPGRWAPGLGRVTLIPVEPIGTRPSAAFVEYSDGTGGLASVLKKEYPPERVGEGKAFRYFRVRHGLSIGDAARLLGLRVTQISDIEFGAATMSESDFRFAFRAFAGRKKKGGPDRTGRGAT